MNEKKKEKEKESYGDKSKESNSGEIIGGNQLKTISRMLRTTFTANNSPEFLTHLPPPR